MVVKDEHQCLKTTNKVLFSSTIGTSALCFFLLQFPVSLFTFSPLALFQKASMKIKKIKNKKAYATSGCGRSCQKVVVNISFSNV